MTFLRIANIRWRRAARHRDKGKAIRLKRHGVGRISINPQTLHDRVLQNIGRKHTVDDFYKAYDIAKSVGFDTINTDLIAGLSGDTVEVFKKR